jgi:archaellum biogenesis protein FlaJ (TadC family)
MVQKHYQAVVMRKMMELVSYLVHLSIPLSATTLALATVTVVVILKTKDPLLLVLQLKCLIWVGIHHGMMILILIMKYSEPLLRMLPLVPTAKCWLAQDICA